jgi:hypothetical protein
MSDGDHENALEEADERTSNSLPKFNPTFGMTQMNTMKTIETHDIHLIGRELVLAFILAFELGSPYFQDAVMNQICRGFTPDVPPSPAYIQEIYRYAPQSVSGLKKFVIDYMLWGWATLPHLNHIAPMMVRKGQVPTSPLPDLSNYLPAFVSDVQNTLHAVSQGREKIVDFKNVWAWVRDSEGGMQRCRFHGHDNAYLGRGQKDAVCFGYVVV